MERKIKRIEHQNKQIIESTHKNNALHQVIDSFVQMGALDDKKYATTLAASMFAKGKSNAAVYLGLKRKLIPEEIIVACLDSLHESMHPNAVEGENVKEMTELKTALLFARKKSLGPFSKKGNETLSHIEKMKYKQKKAS